MYFRNLKRIKRLFSYSMIIVNQTRSNNEENLAANNDNNLFESVYRYLRPALSI